MSLAALLATAAWLSLAASDATPRFSVQPDTSQSGISFVKREEFTLSEHYWLLTVDHHFDDYTLVLDTLDKDLTALTSSAAQVRVSAHDRMTQALNGYVKDLVSFEFNHLRNQIQDTRRLLRDVKLTMTPLEASAGRTRRAAVFDGGSTALKWLFGVAKSEDLDQLSARVDKQGVVQNDMVHMIEDSMSVINATSFSAHENSRQLKRLADATAMLSDKLGNLSVSFQEDLAEVTRRMAASVAIATTARIIRDILDAARERVSHLERAWSETAAGRLSVHFLPPAALNKALLEITEQLPGKFHFPVKPNSAHLYQFYSFASVTAALASDSKLRLFIQLPLADAARHFTAWQAVSVPIRHPQSDLFAFTIPESPLLAVSDDLQNFILIQEADLNQCKGATFKICSVNWDLKSAGHPACSIAAFLNRTDTHSVCPVHLTASMAPFFMNAPHSNKWLFSVPTPTRATVACPRGGDTTRLDTTTHGVTASGVLTLDHRCEAQIGNHVLTARAVGRTHGTHNDTGAVLMPAFRPTWPTLSNLSVVKTLTQRPSAARSDACATCDSVSSRMRVLLQNPAGLSAQTLDELHSLRADAAAANSELSDTHGLYHATASVSTTALLISTGLLAIFIYRYRLMLRKHGQQHEPAAVPLTSPPRS